MAWIESHQSLSRHRKTLALAALLRTDRHKILGHLHELWWWALDNADIYGSIGFTSDEVIAEASGWPLRQATAWVSALKEAGYLDETEDGLSLHDWYEYAGKINQRRAENTERMRLKRESQTPPPGPRTNGTSAQHVRSTNAARAPATVPNRTGPNQTNLTEEAASAAMSASADAPRPPGVKDDPVDAVYEHFKAQVQPRSRLCPRKKIMARLKHFAVDELREGVDHFAADQWEMEHNASRGAEWFFDSDARSEHLLLLQPRGGPQPIPITERMPSPRCPCGNTTYFPEDGETCQRCRNRGLLTAADVAAAQHKRPMSPTGGAA